MSIAEQDMVAWVLGTNNMCGNPWRYNSSCWSFYPRDQKNYYGGDGIKVLLLFSRAAGNVTSQ